LREISPIVKLRTFFLDFGTLVFIHSSLVEPDAPFLKCRLDAITARFVYALIEVAGLSETERGFLLGC
jgi:hypothetical protein